jgi:hypothetical protein
MEFLTFRKFIAPVVVQIIFWLGVVGVIISGILMIVQGGRFGGGQGGQAIVVGLLMIILGPIVVRLYCEILIVFFRIYDALNAIRMNTQPQGQGYPPQGYAPPQQGGYPPPPPPPGHNPQRWQ